MLNDVFECEVRTPLIPEEGKTPQLKIKMPDVPVAVWVDEIGKDKWIARFPRFMIKQAFAKSTTKEGIIQELRARWRIVGALEPRGERPE